MTDPFYRVVRVEHGKEQVLLDIPWRDLEDRSNEGAKYAVRKGRTSQEERAEAFEFASKQKGHIRIYSSQDDGTLGPSDIIWDSEL